MLCFKYSNPIKQRSRKMQLNNWPGQGKVIELYLRRTLVPQKYK